MYSLTLLFIFVKTILTLDYFIPIRKKTLYPAVSQGVPEHHFQHIEWYCGDVRPDSCSLQNMLRVTNAGSDHLR